MKTSRGLTLIELLVGLGILAGIFTALLLYLKHNLNEADSTKSKLVVHANLPKAMQMILLTGRLSRQCVIPDPLTLECEFAQPVGGATHRRFRKVVDAPAIIIEQKNGIWSRFDMIPFVTNFEVCGEATLRDGTCPITPAVLTTVFNANVTAVNRFFRYRLTFVIDGPNLHEVDFQRTDVAQLQVMNLAGARTLALSGAFFIRSPFLGAKELQYGYQADVPF